MPENVLVVEEIFGRSDRALGATKIGELKKALGGGRGHGEVLRYEDPQTEPIFGQSEGTLRVPRDFECLKGSGQESKNGKLKDKTKRYKNRTRCPSAPPGNTSILSFEMCWVSSTLPASSTSLSGKKEQF